MFGRLTHHDVSTITPDAAYGVFGMALQPFADQGRLKPQPRSYKIDYRPGRLPGEEFLRSAAAEYGWARQRVDRVVRELDQLAFEFSVDVVPTATPRSGPWTTSSSTSAPRPAASPSCTTPRQPP